MTRSIPATNRAAIINGLSDEDLSSLEFDWQFWGRPEQQLPAGDDWLTWILLAGRGFGKTRTGSEAIRALVCGPTPHSGGQYRRVALVAETAADARDVMVEGDAGLLRVHPRDFRPHYEPSKRRLTWPNGTKAFLYNAVEPDQLRGPSHSLAWCDELAKWTYAQETWDQLQFGLRGGDKPRQIITTTPRPIPVVRRVIADPTTVVTRGTTYDNRANLPPSFFSQIVARYEGTRLGRQELNAEILEDVEGALWTRKMIDQARKPCAVPDMLRVVVAIDPSGTRGASDSGDSIGIVVAGKGTDGRGYVMADRSCKLSPAAWGRVAVRAYDEFSASRIVAERNFGGAMVEHVIRTTDPTVAYSEVTAMPARGKVVRAEPIAALYEQGKITHVGDLALLEDQMCQMTTDGFLGDGSPDRVDAAVWALSETMLTRDTRAFTSTYRGGF